MPLKIFTSDDYSAYKPYFASLRYYYRKTLKVLANERDFIVNLVLVNEEIIYNMNRKYRHIDRPTDVLSFASIDDDDHNEDDLYLGDILISIDAVKSQAIEYGHSEKRELCFLFVHGLLHCLGFDHMTKEDEDIMFGYQDKILGDLR